MIVHNPPSETLAAVVQFALYPFGRSYVDVVAIVVVAIADFDTFLARKKTSHSIMLIQFSLVFRDAGSKLKKTEVRQSRKN